MDVDIYSSLFFSRRHYRKWTSILFYFFFFLISFDEDIKDGRGHSFSFLCSFFFLFFFLFFLFFPCFSLFLYFLFPFFSVICFLFFFLFFSIFFHEDVILDGHCDALGHHWLDIVNDLVGFLARTCKTSLVLCGVDDASSKSGQRCFLSTFLLTATKLSRTIGLCHPTVDS